MMMVMMMMMMMMVMMVMMMMKMMSSLAETCETTRGEPERAVNAAHSTTTGPNHQLMIIVNTKIQIQTQHQIHLRYK